MKAFIAIFLYFSALVAVVQGQTAAPKAEVAVNCNGNDRQTRYFCWAYYQRGHLELENGSGIKSAEVDFDLRYFYRNKVVVGLTVLKDKGSWKGTLLIKIDGRNLNGSASAVAEIVNSQILASGRRPVAQVGKKE